MSNLYIFIDPFNSNTSGVSNYIFETVKRIEKVFLYKVEIKVLSINYGEKLFNFKKRIYDFLEKNDYFLVEFPDSMGLSCDLKDQSRVHVRIHCGKTLGKYVQGIRFNKREFLKEKNSIIKANMVSAPSIISKIYTFEFYNVNREALVYPNPINILFKCESKDLNVVFLGRLQNLKGYEFLNKFSKKSKFKINILTNVVCNSKGFNFLKYEDIEEKYKYLSRAKVVIVPSLFDIYSMVALEAIACNSHVVTWEHIGIVEYFGEEYVSKIAVWDFDKFVEVVEDKINCFIMPDSEEVILKLNKKFDITFEKILNSDYVKIKSENILNSVPLDELINSMPKNNLNKNGYNVFLRKVRKLLKDPYYFWKDSLLREKLQEIGVYDSKINENVIPEKISNPKLKGVALNKSLVQVGKDEISTVVKKEDDSGCVGIVDFNDLTLIKLIFLRLPKPKDTETLFISSNNFFLRRLKESLNDHNDFSPFRLNNFRYLKIINENSILDCENVLDLLNRFDLKSKEYISSYKNIVLIDCPELMVRVVRFIGYNHKIIYVNSGNLTNNKFYLQQFVDCYIQNEEIIGEKPISFRKEFLYKNFIELSCVLRKVVQDNLKKDLDLLIPVYNGLKLKVNFDELNNSGYQCYIFMRQSFRNANIDCLDFDGYIDGFIDYIDDIVVKESIYLTYKGLVDDLGDVINVKLFVSLMLKDGVFIDVRF